MKRIKLTFHPFTHWRVSKPMTEAEAQQRYEKACEVYAPYRSGLFAVDVEIIDA